MGLKDVNASTWRDRLGSTTAKYELNHRYRIALDRVGHRRPERWLDVGAGNGFLASVVKDALPEVHATGIDFVQEALDVADALDEKKVVDLDAEGLPFEDDRFDMITCLEVLEHVVSPDNLLAEIHRVLRAGGACLISVPNLQFIEYTIALMRGKMPHPAADKRHMSIYTLRFLEKQMREAGLSIEFTAGCNASPAWLSKISSRQLCKTILAEGVKAG
jgi:ubiquinone/menaquinone biosynthesis C-methylase UbiE